MLAAAALSGAVAAAQPPADPTPGLIRGADPSIWEGQETSGPIVHRASRAALPDKMGSFSRQEVAAVGPEDVIARYGATEGTTVTQISLYLFRPAASREHRLKGSVESFADLHPGAFLWSAGPFDIKAPVPLHAWKGVFKTGIGPGTLMDYLYFASLGRWTVKVRATVSGIKEPAQEAAIDSLVAGLPWAQILAANGECSGAACRAPPAFEPFRHHIMETTLGPLLMTRMKFKPKEESKLPVVGQVDASLFGKAEIRRSDAGELLYVAAIPKFFTYRIIRLPPPVKMMFTDGFGTLSIDKPVHALVIEVGDAGLMPRLYNGEPSPEAFAAAIEELVMQEMPAQFVGAAAFAKTLEDRP